jgi:uncharacterized protein YjbI with pentapeptide repeats
MPLVNFSNVDFDEIKQSIKDYLRANSNFTDYDFEGSNLSTIIDTLAYNTYISSYNANMVSNEVFLDSATLRENVVSIARNIGYLPRSRKSSKASVSFSVNASDSNVVSMTLKAGPVVLSGSNFNRQSFTFCIMEDITAVVDSDGIATFDNVYVCEGSYLNSTFTVDSSLPNQRFILPNSGIDTSNLNVIVRKSAGNSVTRKYTRYDNLAGVDGDTPLYFLRESEGETYELLFGDGLFGKQLEDANQVEVNYLSCSGSVSNGVSNFTYIGTLQDQNGASVTSGISGVTVNQISSGGAEIESVESIKKYAPNIYASQNRAVTSTDFESLIPRIYPETESVSAFGGEESDPPQYGKVFISIKPYNGVFISEEIKRDIQLELRKYSVAGIVSEIIDLKYLYIEVDTNVYYNSNQTPGSSQVTTAVTNNIINYANSTQLNKFGARFKYSKFIKVIDDSNEFITSNITIIHMRRDLSPLQNQFVEYNIGFGNEIHIKNQIGFNIKTSGFIVSGISGTVYMGDSPNADLRTGTIFLFRLNSPTEPVIVKRNIGTIDYKKGLISLNPLNVLSTEVVRGTPLIEISACPHSNDVIGLQDLYLQLDTSKVNVTPIPDSISSGSDTSGGTYTVSSSFSNGSLVRGEGGHSSTGTTTTNQTVSRLTTSSVSTTTSTTTSSGSSGSSY